MGKKSLRKSIAANPLFIFFIILVLMSSISSIAMLSYHHSQKPDAQQSDIPRRSQDAQGQIKDAIANSSSTKTIPKNASPEKSSTEKPSVAVTPAEKGDTHSKHDKSEDEQHETGAKVQGGHSGAESGDDSSERHGTDSEKDHDSSKGSHTDNADEEESDSDVDKKHEGRHKGNKHAAHHHEDSEDLSADPEDDESSTEKGKHGRKKSGKHQHHHQHGKKTASSSSSSSSGEESSSSSNKPAPESGNAYVNVKLGDVTIVTAYYRIESKHSDDEYDHWISNIMSITDPMIIFTSEDLAPNLKRQRAHSKDLTKIVIQPLSESLMGTNYSREFWNGEFKKDPEAFRHKSVELYWIWNEKPNWLKQAVEMNPFHSSFFAWVDIGYLRENKNKYKGKQMVVRLPATIKDHEVMLLNVNTYKIKDMDPSALLHDNRVGGNFIGGRAEVCMCGCLWMCGCAGVYVRVRVSERVLHVCGGRDFCRSMCVRVIVIVFLGLHTHAHARVFSVLEHNGCAQSSVFV
jgi:hypothetical protein